MDSLNLCDLESSAKTVLTNLGIKDFNQKVKELSGGQRKRVSLASALITPCELLILDEPTNDLDIETMTILEDYLDSFDGIVITVSLDWYFLDRVVRRIFSFEGNGVIRQYEGGYTDYINKKKENETPEENIFSNSKSKNSSEDKNGKPDYKNRNKKYIKVKNASGKYGYVKVGSSMLFTRN